MSKILAKIIQSFGVGSVLALLACGAVGPGTGGGGALGGGSGGSEGSIRNAAAPTYDGGNANPVTEVYPMRNPAIKLEMIWVKKEITAGIDNGKGIPVTIKGTVECRFTEPKGDEYPFCDVGGVLRMVDVLDKKYIQTSLFLFPNDTQLYFELSLNVSKTSFDSQNSDPSYWGFYLNRKKGPVSPMDQEVNCVGRSECTHTALLDDWVGEGGDFKDPIFQNIVAPLPQNGLTFDIE